MTEPAGCRGIRGGERCRKHRPPWSRTESWHQMHRTETKTTIEKPCAAISPFGDIDLPEGLSFRGIDQTGAYALRVLGNGLYPVVIDGDTAIVVPLGDCRPQDFVVLHFQDSRGPVIWRLVMPPLVPPGTPIPRGATLHPPVLVEGLNPRRLLQFRVDKLTAMHRVLGFLRADGSMADLPLSVRVRRAA